MPHLPQDAVPQENEAPVIKVQTVNVIVDVAVTDRDGNPVQGLNEQDFLLFENGEPQHIAFFEEHTGARSVQGKTPVLPPNVFTNIPRQASPDATVVLLLDSLNTQLQDQVFVRSQILEFLKHPLQGRRIAIFTLSDKLRMIQDFSDDSSVSAASIANPNSGANPKASPELSSTDAIDGEANLLTSLEIPEGARQAVLRSLSRQNATSTDARVAMTLEAFRFLAHYLGGIPGRKSVLWFSGAFPLRIAPDSTFAGVTGEERDYGSEIRKTDQLLSEARITIYPIDAQGVVADLQFNPDQKTDLQSQITKGLEGDSFAAHDAMKAIAQETGGEAIYNTNGFEESVAKIVRNVPFFYPLGYAPAGRAAGGGFRRITIKIAHGNYKLAYREGYYPVDITTGRNKPMPSSTDPLRALMSFNSPNSTEIPFAQQVHRLPSAPASESKKGESQLANPAGYTNHLVIQFAIRPNDLRLETSSDGSRHGRLEAEVIIFDANGQILNSALSQIPLDMSESRYEGVQKHGVNFILAIDAPGSATYLSTGIYDWMSFRAGTLEIPMREIFGPVSSATGPGRH